MTEEELLEKITLEKDKRKLPKQRTRNEWLLEKELKAVREAKKANIEYIESLVCEKGNRDYANYKLNCGHLQKLQITHVRRNNFKCEQCNQIRLENFCLYNSLTFVGKDPIHRSRSIFCRNTCGHSFIAGLSALEKSGVPDCQDCYEEYLKAKAKENGLTYIGRYSACGTKREYVFDKCGHLKKSFPRVVNRGSAVCRECQEDDYRKIAKVQGLSYLGKPKESLSNKRLFKLPCGCNKELRIDHLKDGVWLCVFCNESHLTKPSQVYLLKMSVGDFSWLKLGFAKNIKTRTSNYMLSSNVKVEVLHQIPFETGSEALLFEKNLHKLLKAFRLDKALVSEYMKNGQTECYPVNCKDIILTHLERANDQ